MGCIMGSGVELAEPKGDLGTLSKFELVHEALDGACVKIQPAVQGIEQR